MFRKILVPVDLTPKNAAAIELAAGLVERGGDGAEVILFHVIETLDVPFEELEDFYTRLEETARERMAVLAKPLRDAGIDVLQFVCYGKRVREIVSYAHDNEIDLIVIGSHRLDPEHVDRSWMTISHQIAVLAANPVLVVK